MLQFIRSKAGSFVVKVLFVLLIMSFGVWGIGDFLRQTPHETTVISVGSEQVHADELDTRIQREMEHIRQAFGGNVDLAQARQLGIVDRVIDQVVNSSLLDQEARRLSLVVGDKQVAQTLVDQPAFHGPAGTFDRTTFLSVLAANRLTEGQYVSSIRTDIPRQTLASVTLEHVPVPTVLSDLLFKIRNEQRVADWVFLPSATVIGLPTPDDKTLQTYYDQHHEAFTAPEMRGFTALVLLPSDVDSQVTIDDDKLQAAYQQRADEFTQIEKRHVLQLVLPDEKAAEDAEAALTAGKDFDEVARTIAKQDKDTVDLGMVAKTDLPTDLAGPAFAAKANETTAPIKSFLGWHILRITDIQTGGVKSFESVKGQLTEDLRKEEAADLLYKLSNKVEDAIAAGADLSAIAEQFKLKPFIVAASDVNGKDTAGQPIPGFPIAADTLLKTVFETADGQVSSVQEAPESSAFYVIKVDKVTPPTLKPFDTIKSAVKDAWVLDQRRIKVAEQGKALEAQVKPDMPLSKLAEAMGLTVKTTKPFTRANLTADAPIPSDVVKGLFDAAPGGAAMGESPDGVFVAQLKEIRAADPTMDKIGVTKQNEALEQKLGGELLQEFTMALRQRYPVEIRQAAIDKILGATGQ